MFFKIDKISFKEALSIAYFNRVSLGSYAFFKTEGVSYLLSGKADILSGRHLDVREDLEALVKRSKEIIDKDLLRLRIPR